MTVTASKSSPQTELQRLPGFKNPPVSEVALSVQFDPLPGLQIHHFGLLWNQIQPCEVWEKHAQVGRVLNVMAPEFREEKLPTPELFRFTAQYVMGENDAPIGRFHLDFQPAFRTADKRPIFRMNLVARGKPI